jgi:hypothetical protein
MNPANAVNHKALLRRITTLSNKLRIAKDVPCFPGTKESANKSEPQAPARHLPLRQPSRQVGFSRFARFLRAWGPLPPWRKFRHDLAKLQRASQTHGEWVTRATMKRAADGRQSLRPTVREPSGRATELTARAAKNSCVLRKTRAERYGSGTGTDRRSNAALGRNSRATAQASARGLIPSYARSAARRRE